jgi:hypothetical protein
VDRRTDIEATSTLYIHFMHVVQETRKKLTDFVTTFDIVDERGTRFSHLAPYHQTSETGIKSS